VIYGIVGQDTLPLFVVALLVWCCLFVLWFAGNFGCVWFALKGKAYLGLRGF
jgi:hypothetical protein